MTRLLPALIVVLLCTAGCPKPVVEEASHFPLQGLHAPLTCSQCHGEQVTTLPSHCSGCHEPDRPADHYVGECSDCHSESGWELAVSDHSFFPLDFGHSGLLCLDCHDEELSPADPTCTACHTRPSGHFDGACDTCHTIRDWSGAAVDHDPFFPTPHEGVSACEDCHPSADNGDYTTFSCIDCHEHSRSEMDREHFGEVEGYVYQNFACLNCHPNGEEDD